MTFIMSFHLLAVLWGVINNEVGHFEDIPKLKVCAKYHFSLFGDNGLIFLINYPFWGFKHVITLCTRINKKN